MSYCVALVITLILVLGLPACSSTPPVIERCIVGDAGLVCVDMRKPEKEQSYDRTFKNAVNMICTNPDDFGVWLEWIQRNTK